MLQTAILQQQEDVPDERRVDPMNDGIYGNRLIQQGLFAEDETEVDLLDEPDQPQTCDFTIDPPRNGRVRCDFELGVCNLLCEEGHKPVGCKPRTECLCNSNGCDWTTLGRNCECQSETHVLERWRDGEFKCICFN